MNLRMEVTGTEFINLETLYNTVAGYLTGETSLADIRDTPLTSNSGLLANQEEDTVQWMVHCLLSANHHVPECISGVNMLYCRECTTALINASTDIFCPYEDHLHISISISVR